MNKDEQITIYQRAKKHFPAVKYSAFKSSVSLHCGMFSHSSVIRPMKVKRPMKLAIEECERRHSTAIWTGPNKNQNHPIKSPGKTYLNYIEAGRMKYHHHQVSCEGSTQVIDGSVYEGILTLVDVEIEVQMVAARMTEHGFEVRDREVTFGEGPRDSQITQGQETYLWKNVWSRVKSCPLLRMTKMGVKIIKGKNNHTIIFNERHKIYIILTKQILMKEANCEKGVYFETNLDDILVRRNLGQGDEEKE